MSVEGIFREKPTAAHIQKRSVEERISKLPVMVQKSLFKKPEYSRLYLEQQSREFIITDLTKKPSTLPSSFTKVEAAYYGDKLQKKYVYLKKQYEEAVTEEEIEQLGFKDLPTTFIALTHNIEKCVEINPVFLSPPVNTQNPTGQ
ncbi:MAG: hypothetical protein ACHQT8_00260 [Chlamydiales bacterium]